MLCYNDTHKNLEFDFKSKEYTYVHLDTAKREFSIHAFGKSKT